MRKKDYTTTPVFARMEHQIKRQKRLARQKTIQHRRSCSDHLREEVLDILKHSRQFCITDTAKKLRKPFETILDCLVQLRQQNLIHHTESGWHAKESHTI